VEQDADGAVAALYHMHYGPLVRLTALLVQDVAVAEGLVQDSFVAMHSVWRRLADCDRALSYLYRAVVALSRTVEPLMVTEVERSAILSALRTLAPRQREVLVLLYYSNLTEAQTASAMRVSKRALKRHTALAMSSLRAELRGTGG
jgi:DNA-directed RNA polymerase specialized sigma24 family protein